MVQPVEMMDLLYKFLGVHVDGSADIAGTGLALRGTTNPGLLLIVALLGLAAVVYAYRYLSEDLPRRRQVLLGILRVIFLLLVIGLLLRPTLILTLEGHVRRTVLLVFDGSASMGIRDAHGTRSDMLKDVLTNEKNQLLPRLARKFDLVPFEFGQHLTEFVESNRFDWVNQLSTNSPSTAIGDAVREAINRKRGQPLAGVFLVTDGANNAGTSPREAAALAGQEGVPLFVYGIGRSAPPDIAVAGVFAQELAFMDDEVPVMVRVRATGMSGRTARLALMLGDQVVAQENVTFTGDAEQVVALNFTPKEKGEFDLKAVIAPFTDEVVRDNNERAQHLRVIDAKIKVLLVEQSPRWEWRYLQALLVRDRRVKLKCVLLEGDPAIATGEDSPYLTEFPKIKEDLYAYDLVILGDVDPKTFSADQLDNLGRFVSEFGGSLLMVAGKRYSPYAYRKTIIERMLPVEFDVAATEGLGDPLANTPIKLELTSDGKVSKMLQLSDSMEENLTRWAALPPVYWVCRVSRAKPAAEVLLVDADPNKSSRASKMPVVASQQYGMGRVMFVGTDNTWRWRKNVGDTYYVALWGQMVQRLALTHLLGGAKRTQLSASRQNYFMGERVTVYARLYTASFEPVTESVIRGYHANRTAPGAGAGAETEVLLRPVPDQPGAYRGEFVAPAPGNYKFHLERDQDTQLDFNVLTPRFEMGDTALNEPLLKEMAQLSDGVFLRDADLPRLPELIGRKTDKVSSTQEVELWSSPLFFILLVLVVSTEWILRKVYQLK
jgi:uncharacterized membrane protein